jgi:hypothetical protein
LAVEAGFVGLSEKKVRLRSGAAFAFTCRDAKGRTWYVDVVGGLTTGGGGLRRGDLLWRSLGQAAVARAEDPGCRVLLLTTELPGRGSAGAKALSLAQGDAIDAALALAHADTPQHLRRLASGRRLA